MKLGTDRGFLPPSSGVVLDDRSDSPVINSRGQAIFALDLEPEVGVRDATSGLFVGGIGP